MLKAQQLYLQNLRMMSATTGVDTRDKQVLVMETMRIQKEYEMLKRLKDESVANARQLALEKQMQYIKEKNTNREKYSNTSNTGVPKGSQISQGIGDSSWGTSEGGFSTNERYIASLRKAQRDAVQVKMKRFIWGLEIAKLKELQYEKLNERLLLEQDQFGWCRDSRECRDNQDCIDGKCMECQIDDDCAQGATCRNNKCYAPFKDREEVDAPIDSTTASPDLIGTSEGQFPKNPCGPVDQTNTTTGSHTQPGGETHMSERGLAGPCAGDGQDCETPAEIETLEEAANDPCAKCGPLENEKPGTCEPLEEDPDLVEDMEDFNEDAEANSYCEYDTDCGTQLAYQANDPVNPGVFSDNSCLPGCPLPPGVDPCSPAAEFYCQLVPEFESGNCCEGDGIFVPEGFDPEGIGDPTVQSNGLRARRRGGQRQVVASPTRKVFNQPCSESVNSKALRRVIENQGGKYDHMTESQKLEVVKADSNSKFVLERDPKSGGKLLRLVSTLR